MHPVVVSSCAVLCAVSLLTFVSRAECTPLAGREDLANSIDDDAEPVRIRNPYFYDLLQNIEQDLINRRELLENLQLLVASGLSTQKRATKGSRGAWGSLNRGSASEALNNTKRGLDLGLSRGFSGSQAAKHLMGLAAANFAGGPGRRRRSYQS